MAQHVIRGAALAALFVYLAVGLTARFAADDVCQYASVQERGVIGSTVYTYETWSGRYSQLLVSNVLYAAFREAAPVISAVLLIVGIAALSWHVNGVAGLLGALALILALRENVWQGVYWLPGGMTYLAPIVVGLMIVLMERGKVFQHPQQR